ncbi:MAG: hypothetical protein SFW67_28760 [Myxococcaceae bacterium]|nr:hypothetical protein [Myxococcaceae bacterium]
MPFVQNGSPHAIIAGWNASGGHAAEEPVQVSVASQVLTAPRQIVIADAKVLGGQLAEEPVQVSAGSQTPALIRQTFVEPSRALTGHAGDVPVQNSAGSQAPALARHSRVEGDSASGGHVDALPEQNSAGSHAPAEGRQRSLFGRKVHAPVAPHTSQAPLQALLQQTPLLAASRAQKPDWHSPEPPQLWPSAFRGWHPLAPAQYWLLAQAITSIGQLGLPAQVS